MNRLRFYIFFACFACFACSCERSNKNITTDFTKDINVFFDEFDTLAFKNCDEAISAGNKILEAYFQTANKAISEDDAKSKSDLDRFEKLMNNFDSIVEEMYYTCPEKIDAWTKNRDKQMADFYNKISNIGSKKEPEDTIIEWDENISAEVDSQVQNLKIRINELLEEENNDTTK